MRKLLPILVLVPIAAAALPAAASTAPRPATATPARAYSVLYAKGVSPAAAHRAIQRLGGRLVSENRTVGLATVVTRNRAFLSQVAGEPALYGAARNRPIGFAPRLVRPKGADVERPRGATGAGGLAPHAASGGDPLSGLQWDMEMIRATADGSYAVNRGSRRVLVGIMDTGIDATHPDLAANFSRSLSRNFTHDIPLIDGPCSEEPDRSCSDPPTVDEDGHGTHVAGTVGAALNGIGVAGVAPRVRLVNIRAGQDSGFFFLGPTVNAMTYAGKVGIDVVNMSFFTDPWLFNCAHNPADSPQEQMEQRTVIAATQRAVDFARSRGVTLIAAEGNENTDLGHPGVDDTSPDFPPGSEKHRNVTNNCLVMPDEARGVLDVTSLGPSERKSYFSNWGVEQTTVAAPGGDFRDFFGTPQYRSTDNLILSAMPESVGRASGDIDEDGNPTTPFVLRNCVRGVCGYYQYLQGTSMAAPHAVGVAALIVSRRGHADPRHPGGLTLAPNAVERVLTGSARKHACPSPRLFHYPDPDLPARDFNAFCAGGRAFNGFYGHGIVNALAAGR